MNQESQNETPMLERNIEALLRAASKHPNMEKMERAVAAEARRQRNRQAAAIARRWAAGLAVAGIVLVVMARIFVMSTVASGSAGKLLAPRGDVKAGMGDTLRPVSKAIPIHDGQVIETGMGSQATLKLNGGVEAVVSPRTRLMVADNGARIVVDHGYISVAAEKRAPDSALRIETPGAVAKVLGTRLNVRVAKQPETRAKTWVRVSSGKVALAAAATDVVLHAGMEGYVEEGAAPTPRCANHEMDELLGVLQGLRKDDAPVACCKVAEDGSAWVWTLQPVRYANEWVVNIAPNVYAVRAYALEGFELPVATEGTRVRVDLSPLSASDGKPILVVLKSRVARLFERQSDGSCLFNALGGDNNGNMMVQFRLPAGATQFDTADMSGTELIDGGPAITMAVPVSSVAQFFGAVAGIAAPSTAARLGFSLPETDIAISGTITDAETKAPIANATVFGHITVWHMMGSNSWNEMPEQEVKTDAEGRYQLNFKVKLTLSGSFAGKDNVCVSATADGYETLPFYIKDPITLASHDLKNVDLALRHGHCARGRLLDAAGNPVAGAYIRVQNGMSGDWNYFGSLGRTYSDANGRFAVWTGLKESALGPNGWLAISKPGEGFRLLFDFLDKDDLGEITLDKGCAISGRVVDLHGQPVADCEVLALGFPLETIATTKTGPDGRYTLTGIPGAKSMSEFLKRKNGNVQNEFLQVDVYTRPEEMAIREAPHSKVSVVDSGTVSCPDFVVGGDASVSGRVVFPPKGPYVDGMIVMTGDGWEHTVKVDADGSFTSPCVPPGKHTLAAYLPTNLRYRGVGRVEIDVQPGQRLEDIEIPIEPLATFHIQYVDANGAPMEGITAAGGWPHTGFWTEGTVSDASGWATLYTETDSKQFIEGFDMRENWCLMPEAVSFMQPEPFAVYDMQITMLPAASLKAELLGPDGKPLAQKRVVCEYVPADGRDMAMPADTDANGRVTVPRLRPGMAAVHFETYPPEAELDVDGKVTLNPGETADLGTVRLKKSGLLKRIKNRFWP